MDPTRAIVLGAGVLLVSSVWLLKRPKSTVRVVASVLRPIET